MPFTPSPDSSITMRTFLVKFLDEGKRRVVRVDAEDVEAALVEFEQLMEEQEVYDWEVIDVIERRSSASSAAAGNLELDDDGEA
jgi:hypothetical protein